MASLNMANMNTLFRKGYLFAGVIMAVNIFVGNEMKASTTFKNPESSQEIPKLDTSQNNNFDHQNLKNPDEQAAQPKKFFGSLLRGLLSWEGRINFFGGALFSVANNYLKLCDYNPGGYWNLRIGCLGLRSKRFLNGMLQFEGNLNLGRGGLWLIPGVIDFLLHFMTERITNTNTAALIMKKILNRVTEDNEIKFGFFYSIFFLVQGFVSMPLTLHFSKFSISISLDSLIWGVTGWILEKKVVPGLPIEGAEKKDDQNDINDINKSQDINKEDMDDNGNKENNLINKDSEENK